MSLISKLLADNLAHGFEDIAMRPPEDREVEVLATVLNYMQYNPASFEEISVPDEQAIIDEVVPVVAAGLVVLEALGPDAEDALLEALKEQGDIRNLDMATAKEFFEGRDDICENDEEELE